MTAPEASAVPSGDEDRGAGGSSSGWSTQLLNRGPSLGGVLVAVLSVTGTSAVDLAPIVVVLGINYLAAAICRRRWVAWVGTIALFGIMPVSQRLDPDLVGALVLVSAVASVAVGVGFVVIRRERELVIQTAAMVLYGACAASGAYVGPRTASYLIGAGLIAHGLWDVIHRRRDVVVSRPFAEFCTVLDLLAGIVVVGRA